VKISFKPTGEATAIYDDSLAFLELGMMEITRASTIEFNRATQHWEVRFTGSPKVVYESTSRSLCVQWEIETLSKQL
jgi:hypothetical protein